MVFSFHPLYLLVLFYGICLVSPQSPGLVYIGLSASHSNVTYTFSQNTLSNASQIPFVVATSDSSAITGNVNISCELTSKSPTVEPYTRISFQSDPVIVTDTQKSGLVSFSVISPGRPIQFQCYGLSEVGTQFVKNSSLSAKKNLEVLQSPTVSICTPKVTVLDTKQKQNVFIELSEPVKDNVTITCESSGSNTNELKLNFESLALKAGNVNTKFKVPFTLNNKGNSSAVIGCYGVSQNSRRQYLKATSVGSRAEFSMQTGNVKILPSHIRASGNNIELYVALTVASEVSFITSATQVTSVNETNDAINNPRCSFSSVNSSSSTNATGWYLSENVLSFSKDSTTRYLPLNLSRSNSPSEAVVQIVIVTVCAPSSSNSALYPPGTSAALKVVIGYIPTINGVAKTGTAATAETQISNPGYVNLASCECDLTSNTCDISCCCDKDCTEEDKKDFICVQGLYGGYTSDGPTLRDCANNYTVDLRVPDYHSILCVFYENNAWLGVFHQTTAGLQKNTEFTNVYKAPRFSMTDDGKRSINEKNVTRSIYRYGYAILTDYETGDQKTFSAGARNRLVLPQPIFSGVCDRYASVRYLIDTESSCDITVTSSECVSNSPLSARSYALSSKASQPACPPYPKIRAQRNSEGLVPVTANYYCLDDVSSYARSSTSGEIKEGFFNQNCTFDNADGSVTCTNLTTYEPITLKRCSWDNGESLPAEPSISADNCTNTVLDVRYDFRWSGTQLTNLDVKVLLGNVKISTSLSQRFKTVFKHNSTLPGTIKRSGLVGYDAGSLIIGGKKIANSSGADFSVDRSYKYQPYIYKPGPDNLCATAGRQSIHFLKGATSGCFVHYPLSVFDNCIELRRTIYQQLKRLVPGDVIGVYGDPSNSTVADWASIHWLVPTIMTSFDNSTLEEVVNVTAAADNTTNVTESTGSNVSFASGIKGFCSSVPNAIIFDFFYAKQGLARYEAIWSIVGVSVRIRTSSFVFRCVSGASNCALNSTLRPWYIQSSVRFSDVPAGWKTSMYGSLGLKKWFTCYWGICWDEFLYPFTADFPGNDKIYTNAMGGLCALVAIYFLCVSWPWW